MAKLNLEKSKKFKGINKRDGNDYVKDLKEYLISNCGKYRQYILNKEIKTLNLYQK